MTAAYQFGLRLKRAFYVSPEMFASGNFSPVPKTKKKKKRKPGDPLGDAQRELDEYEKEQEKLDNEINTPEERKWPQAPAPLPQKSAAYMFGAWVKQASDEPISPYENAPPLSPTPPTLSLGNQQSTPSLLTTGGMSPQDKFYTPRVSNGTTVPDTSSHTRLTSTLGAWWNPGYSSHTGLGTYADTLERWYNPWSTQEVKERGEKGLMRAGQISGGVGAVAGLAAGGIAAAPALLGGGGTVAGGGGLAAAGETAAAASGGALAASQTPAGQNMLQRGTQMLGQGANALQNAAYTYHSRVAPVLDRINYKPEDVLHDGTALVTGNADQIKGPGFAIGKYKPPSMPQGFTSLRPKDLLNAVSTAGMAGNASATPTMAHAGMQ